MILEVMTVHKPTNDDIQLEVQRVLVAVNEQLSPLLGVAYPDYTQAYDNAFVDEPRTHDTVVSEFMHARCDALQHARELRGTALGADRCDMGHEGCLAGRVSCPPFEEMTLNVEEASDDFVPGVYVITDRYSWNARALAACGDDDGNSDEEIS